MLALGPLQVQVLLHRFVRFRNILSNRHRLVKLRSQEAWLIECLCRRDTLVILSEVRSQRLVIHHLFRLHSCLNLNLLGIHKRFHFIFQSTKVVLLGGWRRLSVARWNLHQGCLVETWQGLKRCSRCVLLDQLLFRLLFQLINCFIRLIRVQLKGRTCLVAKTLDICEFFTDLAVRWRRLLYVEVLLLDHNLLLNISYSLTVSLILLCILNLVAITFPINYCRSCSREYPITLFRLVITTFLIANV